MQESVLDQRLRNHLGTDEINQGSSSRVGEKGTDFEKIMSTKSAGLGY